MQCKDDAARQTVDGDKRVVGVSRGAGITASLIGRWMRERVERKDALSLGNGHQTALEEQVCWLRRENARLQERRLILIKFARFMVLEKAVKFLFVDE